MSRCYYFKTEMIVDFIGMKETLEMLYDEYNFAYSELEASEDEINAACFYLVGESARGVQIINKEDCIIIKLNSLCNYKDYELAKFILVLERDFLQTQVIDEDDTKIEPREYFTEEKIQELREDDAKTVLVALKNIVKDNMQIFGVVRNVYFGKNLTQKLLEYEKEPKLLVKMFDSIIHHVQYELPDYDMPGAALIRPKNSEDENNFAKIRMMFKDTPYILQDYDYLTIRSDENPDEIYFINNDDLTEIASQIFSNDSGFEFADDFTVVFPKLDEAAWKKFVSLAREKNHKDLLDGQKKESPSSENDLETDEDDEISNQCHGSHWECIFEDTEKLFPEMMGTVIEKSTTVIGDVEASYKLEEETRGRVIEIEYSEKGKESISIRSVCCVANDSIQLMSMYPCVKEGIVLPLKIIEIKEWENGLEAWIIGELQDDRTITFFDANYAVNKDKYVIGKAYDFMVGGLAYFAKEPETKGFSFEGQEAIDFKTKIGEEPEYDDEGNVMPVKFSTEQLCAFLQTGPAPDDVDFITTVEYVKEVNALENSFWKFETVYRGLDGEEKIPTYVLKSEENMALDKATQLQGVLWLTGFLMKEN